jgi:hypothetical protein
MGNRIAITPAGRLVFETDDEESTELSPVTAEALKNAFAESSAAGLYQLASQSPIERLPAELVFWRDLATQLFHALCGLDEAAPAHAAKSQGDDVLPPPDEEELEERIATAPPMRGLEYLTVEVLRRLWHELRELVLARGAAHADGWESFLRSINPLWHLLGRVTFLGSTPRIAVPATTRGHERFSLVQQACLQTIPRVPRHPPCKEFQRCFRGQRDWG